MYCAMPIKDQMSHVMTKPTIRFPNRSDGNFGFIKEKNCTIHVAKTKGLISFAVNREAGLRL